MPQKLSNGEKFPELDAKNIHGVPVSVPAEDGRLTHLQFRRFAGCPICNLHLQSRGGACGLCGSECVNRRIGYARLWLAHSFRPFSRKPTQRDTGTPLRDLTMTDNRRLPLIPRRDRDQPAVSLSKTTPAARDSLPQAGDEAQVEGGSPRPRASAAPQLLGGRNG